MTLHYLKLDYKIVLIVLKSCCSQWHLRINQVKTKFMVVRKNWSYLSEVKFFFGNEVVTKFTCLSIAKKCFDVWGILKMAAVKSV